MFGCIFFTQKPVKYNIRTVTVVIRTTFQKKFRSDKKNRFEEVTRKIFDFSSE